MLNFAYFVKLTNAKRLFIVFLQPLLTQKNIHFILKAATSDEWEAYQEDEKKNLCLFQRLNWNLYQD